MRVAIVGGGISGLVSAYLLQQRHDIHVFEAAPRIGGHTHTVAVERSDGHHAVDMGFIVFNDRTYPNFTKLLQRIGVSAQPSTMSFGVSCQRSGLEYNGSSLNQLFARRRNLICPGFYRMLGDILRFNRSAARLLSTPDNPSLGEYLAAQRYSAAFREWYLVPMGSAIWSASPHAVLAMPAQLFVRFFRNHGMLDLRNRPQWQVIQGGSDRYLQPLTRLFADRISTACPVERIRRDEHGVELSTQRRGVERFDAVVIATHSDQALAMLADPSADERRTLGAIPYQPNRVVLHTDVGVMPRTRRAWASWNYVIPRSSQDGVAVTYHMNRLQNLSAEDQFCVTLNHHDRIASPHIIREHLFEHPVYTTAGREAQHAFARISGKRQTYFCGAYWGFGFHEDGVNSALAVGRQFGVEWN